MDDVILTRRSAPCRSLCQVVVVVICIGILLSYPIQAYVPVEILWPYVERRFRPLKHPVAAELGFRTAIVLFTCTYQ